jgi:hypothetical protein
VSSRFDTGNTKRGLFSDSDTLPPLRTYISDLPARSSFRDLGFGVRESVVTADSTADDAQSGRDRSRRHQSAQPG